MSADDSVLTVADAVSRFGVDRVRWRVKSGRWQRPRRGVVVTHPGVLTRKEQVIADLLSCGGGAVLGGITAATLDGLSGFMTPVTHVLLPPGLKRAKQDGIVVHRSRALGDADIHPTRRPVRTRIGRSVIDAASWAATEKIAVAVVAASVQQKLVRSSDLRVALERLPKLRHRALIREVVDATDGGSLSAYEVDFLRLCKRFGLPLPTRQVRRRDSTGMTRYTDAEFDGFDVVAEIDGAQHLEVSTWWDDLDRQNDLVIDDKKTVIRFVGLALRRDPRRVAGRLHDCLRMKRPDLHDLRTCKVCRSAVSERP